ncbi:hypothetical protein COI98_25615 [Bacillus cereus]|uniref:Uncharacterized protein n=1 Tax=Bacillus cereus TaxID=1396 RepID=A0A9X6WY10_BACCE|nr:hypothetical protein COI98_25615 [Bacillus cereus]
MKYTIFLTMILRSYFFTSIAKKRRHKAPENWVNEVLVFQSKEIMYQLTMRAYHNMQSKKYALLHI